MRSGIAFAVVPWIVAGLVACSGSNEDEPAGASGSGGSSAGTQSSGGSTSGGSGSGKGGSSGASNGGSAGASSGGSAGASNGGSAGASNGGSAGSGNAGSGGSGATDLGNAPPAGNPDGNATVPPEGALEDTTTSDTVVGTGSPESCTSRAFVDAVARGGVITFDCGTNPVTITLDETAKVFNDTGPRIVIDGGGKITLSGGGVRRILYMNTCDESQVWTTSMCQNQDHPELTVQNLTFVDGNATGETLEGGGGGAIFVRGGRFKIVNSRFFANRCDPEGPDVGGAAVRVLSQYQGLPVYVVNSVFGGAPGLGNVCSNGGGLSSIGVSYTVINSLFSHNEAIGYGANPAQSGTPGGGSGGAIYNDGNTFTLTLDGTRIENNDAREGGGAIFFVSNDRSGELVIRDSVLRMNPSEGFETSGFPGIFVLDDDNRPEVVGETVIE